MMFGETSNHFFQNLLSVTKSTKSSQIILYNNTQQNNFKKKLIIIYTLYDGKLFCVITHLII